MRLLASLHKKKPLAEIAEEHQRSIPSINMYRLMLAIEFYVTDEKSFEEINCLTGLTKSETLNAVKAVKSGKKELYKLARKMVPIPHPIKHVDPTIILILKEISSKLSIIIDKLGDKSVIDAGIDLSVIDTLTKITPHLIKVM